MLVEQLTMLDATTHRHQPDETVAADTRASRKPLAHELDIVVIHAASRLTQAARERRQRSPHRPGVT